MCPVGIQFVGSVKGDEMDVGMVHPESFDGDPDPLRIRGASERCGKGLRGGERLGVAFIVHSEHDLDMVFGDYQNMTWIYRSDIGERNEPIAFPYDMGRDLVRCDLTEDAIWH